MNCGVILLKVRENISLAVIASGYTGLSWSSLNDRQLLKPICKSLKSQQLQIHIWHELGDKVQIR